MGLAYLITSDRLQLLCERKVLKEAEYSVLLDAGGLIETARAEATRLSTVARQQAALGRREGYAAGLREAQAAHADRLLAAAVDDRARLQGLREAMAGLVVKAVSRLLADLDPVRFFESALRHIDELLHDETQAVVRVSPNDEPAVSAAVARLTSHVRVTVQRDTTLPAGSCVLATSAGRLELGVAAQLDALARAMRAADA